MVADDNIYIIGDAFLGPSSFVKANLTARLCVEDILKKMITEIINKESSLNIDINLINFEKEQTTMEFKAGLILLLLAGGGGDAMSKVFEVLGNPALSEQC